MSRHNSTARALGLAAIVIGLVAAIGLWYSASIRESDAVTSLARAPVGCQTSLDFSAAGEYYVFIETEGRLDDSVPGDCDAIEVYDRSNDELPLVVVELLDDAGSVVPLEPAPGVEYSRNGYAGQSLRSFSVEEPGAYSLRVESPEGDSVFSVAVGGDPSSGVGAMKTGAIIAAIAGIVIGGALLLSARRRPASTTVTAGSSAIETPHASTWQPDGRGWPLAPPGTPTPSSLDDPTSPLGPPTVPEGGVSTTPQQGGSLPPPSPWAAPVDLGD